MISFWFNIISYAFLINPYVTIPIAIIIFSIIFFILTMCLAFFLDISNKHISKSSYNFFFDHLIPFILFIIPYIISLKLISENTPWLQKLSYVILCHGFIIIPIIYYWSIHRDWVNKENLNKKKYVVWSNPILYKCLSVALIYPLLWGFYFSFIRYNRLGLTINVIESLSFIDFNYIILILFLMPFIFPWIILSLQRINLIRYWFWYNYVSILEVIHIFLLRYNLYFNLLKKLHKASFILFRYISLVDDVYPRNRKYNKERYILRFFYDKPWLLFIILFSIITIEFIFTLGKIKYGLYLMFWFPLIYGFIFFMYSIYVRDFIQDVCNADYFSSNWKNPRYPYIFWCSFDDDELRYGFKWDFTSDELNILTPLAEKYLHKKIPSYFQFPKKVQHRTYCLRLKASYKASFGVRWVHTNVERPLHSITGYFVHNIVQRLALIHNNWKPHYMILLHAEKTYPSVNESIPWYNDVNNSSDTSIRSVMEHNFITNFIPLTKKGVIVSEYKKGIVFDSKPITNVEPDSIINMRDSLFMDKRIHAIDQKTSTGFSSIVYSNIEDALYKKKLRRFASILLYNHPEMSSQIINDIMDKLVQSCNDISIHQMVWATNLHHFPNDFIPPMKINHHFSLANARPEFVTLFKKAQLTVHKVSDYLYARKIPEIKHCGDPLPEEILNLFSDSELQKILKEG